MGAHPARGARPTPATWICGGCVGAETGEEIAPCVKLVFRQLSHKARITDGRGDAGGIDPMAFGYKRGPGATRYYVNELTGERISRRQYDKYVRALGKNQPVALAIAETERMLDALRLRLAEVSARENEVARREAELAAREAELALEKQLFRKSRTDKGQRRYNAALDAYVAEQRRLGKRISKIDARKSAEFKSLMKDLKGKKNPKQNPKIADENRFNRMKALDRLGGSQVFREYYEKLYGAPVQPASGFGPVNRAGRSSFVPTVRRRVA